MQVTYTYVYSLNHLVYGPVIVSFVIWFHDQWCDEMYMDKNESYAYHVATASNVSKGRLVHPYAKGKYSKWKDKGDVYVWISLRHALRIVTAVDVSESYVIPFYLRLK